MGNLVNGQEENINIIDNIILAFKATELHIKGLSNDITDLLEYKMFVLCLDNAVELLFKFMIARREEILLYADEKTENVLKKYNQAHKKGFTKLEAFFQRYPMENDLHTVSFSKACDFLKDYYQIIGETFASKCKKLAQVRNGFIHYSTTIRYIDVVTFLHIYKKCVCLFEEELKNKPVYDIEALLADEDIGKIYYNMDIVTYCNAKKICKEAICRNIFNNEIFLHIVGFVIDNYNDELIDICPEDCEKIESLFFQKYSKLYGNNLKKKHEEFREVYKIMLDAEIIYEDYEMYDDKLSTLMVTEWVLEEIENRWDEMEQRRRLACNKSVKSVIQSMRRDYEDDWWS